MNTDIKCSKNIGMVRMCITITAKKNIILNKKNKTYTAYNFVWTYDYLGEKINVILHRIYTEDERKIKSERNKKSNTTPKAIASAKARVGLKSPNLEKVKQYDLNGNLIKIWNGTVFILNECKNVSRTNILRCKQRKIKSAGGYVWRFINDDF